MHRLPAHPSCPCSAPRRFGRKPLLVLLVFFLGTLFPGAPLIAQDMEMYRRESLPLWSAALGDSITLDLMLPLSLAVSDPERRLPVLLILDSHNRQTFAHHLASVDILTMQAQIPEMLVVGIPFREDNRYLLTSTKPYGPAGTEGLKVLGDFLFAELLPWLEETRQAGHPRVLAGHSRTAYAVSALMLRHPGQVQAAGAFSGFFESAFLPTQVRELALRPAHAPLHFYFSAGNQSPEEAGYLADYRTVRDSLQALGADVPLRWRYREHDYAGHMANYTLSLPWMLMDYFGPYSLVLTEALFGQVPDRAGLAEAFTGLEPSYGPGLRPELVHYFSFSNAQANQGNAANALALVEEALAHYPGEVDLHYLAALWASELGMTEKARDYARRGLARIDARTDLSPADREGARSEFEAFLD